MTVTEGVNAGFVTTAPTADPSASGSTLDNTARAGKFTSPNSNINVSEIGWYASANSDVENFEVGIYNDNAGSPGTLISKTTKAKGIVKQWERGTVDINLEANTVYWIAVQLDNTSPSTTFQLATSGGEDQRHFGVTELESTWGGIPQGNNLIAVYALYTEVEPTGTNIQLNIGDVWKEVPAVQINIGDAWKEVPGMQINIGDSWKTIF